MSNKSKRQGIVPQLRFPEFRDAGEWEEKEFRKLAKRITQKNKKNTITRVLTNSAAYGIVDQRTYFDKDIANQNNLGGYFIVDKEDYVYNPRVSIIAPVGPISKNKIGKGVISPLYTVFRFKNSNNGFYEQYFKSTHWHQYLRIVSNTGARHDRMSITNNDFEAMPLPVPSPNEQKKIANCLSSLDQLITTQTEKLDSLKAHKKGLMQQLFPAEGETVPKLRFAEFRDAGEWDVKSLDQLTTRIGDGIHSTPKYNDDGNYYFINGNNLVDGKISISVSTKKVDETEANKHSRDISKRTILLSINGTIGNLALYDNERVMLGKSAAYINIKNNVDIDFIYSILKTSKVQNFFFSELTGSTIKNLSLKTIRKTEISIPIPSEQQKIASCISSLDELITTQAQKINTLKIHKKGLMQQLFPSTNEEDE